MACAGSSPKVETPATPNVPVSAPTHTTSGKIEIEVPSETVTEGGIFFASVESQSEIQDATGLFQGHVIDFFPDGEHAADGGYHKYSAVIGVEYGTKPGNVSLSIKTKIGTEFVESHASIAVKSGTYPSERLRVPPRTILPSKKDQKLIAKDRIILGRAYATKTLTKFWDSAVMMPITSDITSLFGTARIYNGKKASVHFGTDLRAPMRTPIAAPMDGQVAVARLLFYTGNTVILDHGFGMFTIYGHLSKLMVKEGDIVKKGQIMGLSGMTGRASGPHLHWGVNLHGTKIDPMVLIQALKKQG